MLIFCHISPDACRHIYFVILPPAAIDFRYAATMPSPIFFFGAAASCLRRRFSPLLTLIFEFSPCCFLFSIYAIFALSPSRFVIFAFYADDY